MLATLRINWVIFRTCVDERLMYRADFAFATLIRFLPIVTQIFLWSAVFAINKPTAHTTLRGYTYSSMVAYYLLAMVARAFSSMPGLSSGIANDVRDGTIKKYLTQPVDMITYLFWARVAHKLVYYIVATGPFVLVFWLCRGFFHEAVTSMTVAAFIASLLLGFLVGFLLETLIGLISFWFLEVSSLIFIFMMLSYFLSGHMIPLDWLPVPLNKWVQFLPFQYLAYFPAAIMLNRFTPSELGLHLTVECAWVLVLFAANRIAFARGVRRYGAFGG